MFGVADYGAFVAAVIVFLMIPGPGNLALITSTGKGRIGGGLAATMGVIAGDQVLMWLAVAGVATLLATYPPAFRAVQWLGAGYLAWLGLRMILAKPGVEAGSEPHQPPAPPKPRWRLPRIVRGSSSSITCAVWRACSWSSATCT